MNELIFWSHYVANLLEKILWFFRKAPVNHWHRVFASVHRMTWNCTLLNFMHPGSIDDALAKVEEREAR